MPKCGGAGLSLGASALLCCARQHGPNLAQWVQIKSSTLLLCHELAHSSWTHRTDSKPCCLRWHAARQPQWRSAAAAAAAAAARSGSTHADRAAAIAAAAAAAAAAVARSAAAAAAAARGSAASQPAAAARHARECAAALCLIEACQSSTRAVEQRSALPAMRMYAHVTCR